MAMFHLIYLVLNLMVITTVNARICSDINNNYPWVSGNGKCYYLIDRPTIKFDAAQAACHQDFFYAATADMSETVITGLYHGRLAFVYDDDEKYLISQLVAKAAFGGKNLWVGLKQVNTEHEPAGGWYWMNHDGTTNKTLGPNTPWQNGEPNNSHGNENYGLWQHHDDDGLDDDKDQDISYMCEIALMD